MDFWIWIIIMVVVALAKGWGKLSEQVDQDSADAPQRPPQKRRPPRPRPTQPAPVGRATPKPPPIRQPTPVGKTITQTRYQREPPVAQVAYAYTPPSPEPVAAPAPVAVAAVVRKKPSRGALWAEALRDKHNLRNVIVGNEIISPPLALREPAENNLTVG